MERVPGTTAAIIARNEANNLPMLFESLLSGSNHDVLDELVFVDNGSTDNTLEVVANYSSKLPIRVFKSPENNMGLARRIAVENTKTKHVAFVDGDCTVNPDWLLNFSRGFEGLSEELPELAGLCSSNPLPENTLWKKVVNISLLSPIANGGSPQGAQYSGVLHVDHLPTTNAYFDVEKVISAGNFNSDFDKTHEDVELGLRLTNSGKDLLYVPNNTVWNDSADSYTGWIKRLFKFAKRRINFNKLSGSKLHRSTVASVGLLALLLNTLVVTFAGFENFIATTMQFMTLSYLFFVLLEGVRSSLRYKVSLTNLLLAPLVSLNILAIHLTYGTGSLFGFLKK